MYHILQCWMPPLLHATIIPDDAGRDDHTCMMKIGKPVLPSDWVLLQRLHVSKRVMPSSMLSNSTVSGPSLAPTLHVWVAAPVPLSKGRTWTCLPADSAKAVEAGHVICMFWDALGSVSSFPRMPEDWMGNQCSQVGKCQKNPLSGKARMRQILRICEHLCSGMNVRKAHPHVQASKGWIVAEAHQVGSSPWEEQADLLDELAQALVGRCQLEPLAMRLPTHQRSLLAAGPRMGPASDAGCSLARCLMRTSLLLLTTSSGPRFSAPLPGGYRIRPKFEPYCQPSASTLPCVSIFQLPCHSQPAWTKHA